MTKDQLKALSSKPASSSLKLSALVGLRGLYVWCLLGVILVSLAGCITLKKGRPPKLSRGTSPFGATQLPIVKEAYSYQQRYKATFVYWDKLMGELIERLGENRKSDIESSQHCLLCLEKLESYLIDEKRALLRPFIEEFKSATADLVARRLSEGELARLKRTLEKHRRKVVKQFSYGRAEDWVRQDVGEIPSEYLEGED